MVRFILSLTIICVVIMADAHCHVVLAQETTENKEVASEIGPVPVIKGVYDGLKPTIMKGKVTDVLDGVTIEINNKVQVRLSGVWVPWETGADPGETVAKAKLLLKKVALGRVVRVHQVLDGKPGRTNRLEQELAHVERDDGMWLQGALLYEGLAFVMTSENNAHAAHRMYAVEKNARDNKRGLWAEKRWEVLPPDEVRPFINEYRIVEGDVFSTATRQNVFYINFSRNWKTDFTAAVPSGKRRAFSRAGVDLMKLNGKKVRVRGWVRSYNGPFIEITHPEQIEILE